MKRPKIILILILILSLTVSLGFKTMELKPQTVYHVYLKGKSLGLITSKERLEDYIDKKQQEIKDKYKVSKVYLPEDLDIVKEITYSNDIKTVEEIYSEIKDISPFTISGYMIKIKGLDTQDANGKKIKGTTKIIYCLDKKMFESAIQKTVKSFIPESDYNAYAEGTQEEIEDTGSIIKNIYIENKITIKKQNIPVDKTIYQNEEDLTKYLLFGTTEKQATYTVKKGDTISKVAFENKLSTEEFLIANTNFTDENSLLSPGQEVTLGIIRPQFNVVEDDYVVLRQEKNFTTETQYDDEKYTDYSEVIQAGIKGEEKVTQRVIKRNGEIISLQNTATETLKEPVTEIIVKGTKTPTYTVGYGVPVPTKGQWGWPATCSNISSPFGYRWGVLHDGTDIAGCGYGSNIFAAQAGTVVDSRKKPGGYAGGYGDNGEYIIIDHHNGYYSMYAHMCPGCRKVSVGDNVVKGQVIGGMGMTGMATGIHVHFAIWYGYPYRGGIAQNAMNFF